MHFFDLFLSEIDSLQFAAIAFIIIFVAENICYLYRFIYNLAFPVIIIF